MCYLLRIYKRSLFKQKSQALCSRYSNIVEISFPKVLPCVLSLKQLVWCLSCMCLTSYLNSLFQEKNAFGDRKADYDFNDVMVKVTATPEKAIKPGEDIPVDEDVTVAESIHGNVTHYSAYIVKITDSANTPAL